MGTPFNEGIAFGESQAGQGQAHKQQWNDLQRQQSIQQNQAASLGIAHILTSGIHPDTGEALSAQDKIQLAQKNKELQAQLQDLWNPRQNVNQMGKSQSAASGVAMPESKLHKVGDLLHLTTAPAQPSNTMVDAKAKGLVQPGNLPIWNRPTVQNADGSHSSEYSTSFTDENGREVLVPTVVNGKFLTPDGKKPVEGSPEEKAMFQRAWQHYEQTQEQLGIFKNGKSADAYAGNLHNRGDQQPNLKSPQQQMDDLRAITQRYQPQPGQPEAEKANFELHSKLRTIEADPKLTKEEKADARRRVYGVADKPSLKLYTLADGTKSWLDASRPDLLPEGATASGTETADTRNRADFAAFQKTNPDYKGTFEQWKTEQAGKGRAAAKPETFDQQYQNILVKKAAGRPLSPDEKARESAWDVWNQKKNIEPGVARAAAFGASRYVPIIDPTDPQKVTLMRAGDAAKAHVGTPASIAFQTDKAITKAFTMGKPADTINYFNTATEHLKLLKEAADALHNGDTQLFNKLANSFATATGSPAPTNFDTVRNAVAGELAKTFKGSGASDEEIGLITATVNNTQSPDQLYGAIDYDLRLMGGKMDALRGQYEKGKQGKPNFSEKDPLGVL